MGMLVAVLLVGTCAASRSRRGDGRTSYGYGQSQGGQSRRSSRSNYQSTSRGNSRSTSRKTIQVFSRFDWGEGKKKIFRQYMGTDVWISDDNCYKIRKSSKTDFPRAMQENYKSKI